MKKSLWQIFRFLYFLKHIFYLNIKNIKNTSKNYHQTHSKNISIKLIYFKIVNSKSLKKYVTLLSPQHIKYVTWLSPQHIKNKTIRIWYLVCVWQWF